MFYVYILESRNDINLYVGYTQNLRKRLVEHNQGKVFSTKLYRPWRYIYIEGCLNQKDASRREYYLKTTQGRRMLKIRLKEYFYQKKGIKFG